MIRIFGLSKCSKQFLEKADFTCLRKETLRESWRFLKVQVFLTSNEKAQTIIVLSYQQFTGPAKGISKWGGGGQNFDWLRRLQHGWDRRARNFLKNWSLRSVKTHSKFNNYFPITLTRLKIKASSTKKSMN